MAKLSAHGTELARRETPTSRIAVMADIMRNQGYGWKLWKRLKPGVDAVDYARRFTERGNALPIEVRMYTEALVNACDLEHRARLHMAIELMPNDPDGVWSTFEDYSGYSLDLDDVCKACRAYLSAQAAVKAEVADVQS